MFPPPARHHLNQALRTLRGGGVIACPTEAVWGLSCDPFDEDAVERLLLLKDRPVEKGLILVAASEAQLAFLLDSLEPQQRETLSRTWPGPATWLVPHGGRVPQWVSGVHTTVALRVSDHPVVRAICEAFGGPLVSTSANPGGARPARALFQVHNYFNDAVDFVLPGRLGASGRPTVIRDLASGEVIRA
ncbi:MAG: Sua5/YciO/YrdC/YwlC family protein [Halioglobus sp.]|nr:Sua5/YciO/YrdC/YwlC family protein [Halioglobus sp.]